MLRFTECLNHLFTLNQVIMKNFIHDNFVDIALVACIVLTITLVFLFNVIV